MRSTGEHDSSRVAYLTGALLAPSPSHKPGYLTMPIFNKGVSKVSSRRKQCIFHHESTADTPLLAVPHSFTVQLSGWAYLPAGELSLLVERRAGRPNQLAVWPAGRPDNVGLVDVPDGASTVRLRTLRYSNDFRAEFGGEYGTSSRSARPLQTAASP